MVVSSQFPAIVEEELKIGDWVRVVGETALGRMDCLDFEFEITSKSSQGNYTGKDVPWFSATSLRKLTPEEIARHAAPQEDFELSLSEVAHHAGVQKNQWGVWTNLPLKRLGEFKEQTGKDLTSIVKRLSVIEGQQEGITGVIRSHGNRLSAIESRLNSLAPSHAELLGDVEALAEKVGAIEKRQEEAREYSDNLQAITDTLADRIYALQKRMDCVEAYQKGEMPEVIDRDQIRIPDNASISMRSDANGKVSIDYSDGGFELAKAVLDSMRRA